MREAGISEWVPIGPSTYQKWNAVLGIRTTVRFEGTGDKRTLHVRHEQPRQVIEDVLDLNVKTQNDFGGYRDQLMVQTSRLPIVVHSQIMNKCGFKPGQGYDDKKFRQILNDRDYYKLKTVPGRV